MEESLASNNNNKEKNSKSNNNPLNETKTAVETLTPIIAAVSSILLFANWLLEWIKKPGFSLAALLTSLIILILSLSWYIYRNRRNDKQGSIWTVILFFLLAIAISLGAIIGFVRGREAKSAELTPTPTAAPTPTIPLAADNSTYSFEQGLQGWEIGDSRTGRLLGTNLERTSEQAFAGSYALKYEQSFEVEAPTIGIGRVKTMPQHRGTELIIAYVKIPADAPTNVGATFFTYRESDGYQNTNVFYADDSESETILRPGNWNVLVWEVTSDKNVSDISIGLKFRLVPKEEIEWDRKSQYYWEKGLVYIDAVQIIRRSSTGESFAVAVPSETPREPTPEATISAAPSATQTPLTSVATSSPYPTPGLTAVVTAEALNLRVGPGIGYEIIRTLKGGETLTLLGRTAKSDWLYAKTSEQEKGWINASYVNSDKNLDTVPTVVAIPTRTLFSAPTALSPLTQHNESFVNEVDLKWRWIRPLSETEYFSVRVSRQDTGEMCFHDKTQDTVYSGPLLFCNSGKLFWETIVVKLLSNNPERWLELSLPSELEFFDFIKETPVPPTNTPVSPDGDNGEKDDGDKAPICPPPC